MSRARMIRRFATGLLVAAVLVAAVIGGRVALDRLRDDTPVETAGDDEDVVVQAQVRDLVETYEATGTLQFEESLPVSAQITGTVLQVSDTGDVVASGDVLALIDDRAVVWLHGDTPAWRTFGEGDEGVDVLQLETALTELGFNEDGEVEVDEEFTWQTEDMVETWQASLGVEETGEIEFGTVVFGTDQTRIASVAVERGDRISAGRPILEIGTSTRFATLDAAPEEAVTLTVGRAVEVELPDRSSVSGSVAALTPAGDTWTITVAFPSGTEFPATDVTTIEVEWTHEVAGDVVSIPSAALLRLDDGTYTVEVVNDDGSITRVPVEIGVAVGTRVEIVSGLTAGMSVRSI